MNLSPDPHFIKQVPWVLQKNAYQLIRLWLSVDHRLENGQGIPTILGSSVQHLEVILILHEDKEQGRQGFWLGIHLEKGFYYKDCSYT